MPPMFQMTRMLALFAAALLSASAGRKPMMIKMLVLLAAAPNLSRRPYRLTSP